MWARDDATPESDGGEKQGDPRRALEHIPPSLSRRLLARAEQDEEGTDLGSCGQVKVSECAETSAGGRVGGRLGQGVDSGLKDGMIDGRQLLLQRTSRRRRSRSVREEQVDTGELRTSESNGRWGDGVESHRVAGADLRSTRDGEKGILPPQPGHLILAFVLDSCEDSQKGRKVNFASKDSGVRCSRQESRWHIESRHRARRANLSNCPSSSSTAERVPSAQSCPSRRLLLHVPCAAQEIVQCRLSLRRLLPLLVNRLQHLEQTLPIQARVDRHAEDLVEPFVGGRRSEVVREAVEDAVRLLGRVDRRVVFARRESISADGFGDVHCDICRTQGRLGQSQCEMNG